MKRILSELLVIVMVGAFSADGVAADDLLKGVKVPPEFSVTLYAAPPDVGYPTCLAAAPNGDLYVGIDENGSLDAKPNRGRVVRCIDSDVDGRADQFKVFAEMDSPRGLWFENNVLYVMHPPFVTAFIDEDGDGAADRSEVLVKGLGFDLKFRGADHTINGMRMGIDGWLYIAMGDYGAVRAVGKDGAGFQLHGGGVARVRPDGTGLELVARGTRNIYDIAISPELDLFTRDNTNDGGGWDVRLSHIIMSGNYGYPTLFKNFPDEIIHPLADYGGGSPCGSLYLDEPGFPAGLGTALYTCEWGRSMVYRHPLERDGVSFKANQEPIIQIPRPTDMDVDGQSRLYVSSWAGGGFTYGGPNVGYVIRVVAKENHAAPFPNLKAASDAQLLALLKSPSAVCRLYTQREILRRGRKNSILEGLERLCLSEASIASRVAAIFTLEQLDPAGAQAVLMRIAARGDVREFALRALADDRRAIEGVPVKFFADALSDPNPRVRLQAVIALGRRKQTEAAGALLRLTAEADPVIAHAAVQSLVRLRAREVCLAAFDSAGSAALTPGAGRVLQALHEPKVADGLIERLNKVSDEAAQEIVFKTLCRLYQREADWDGRWWGTRPDTRGPYFKPVKWEASERIGRALGEFIKRATPETMPKLVMELEQNRVELPEVNALVLKLAETEPDFRPIAVELLVARSSLSSDASAFLHSVAASDQEPVPLRVKAIEGLRKSNAAAALDATVDVLIGLGEPHDDALASARQDFIRDPGNARRLGYFEKLAENAGPAKRVLGYSVLVHLANTRVSSKRAQAAAARAIERAWGKPESTVSLLGAIARMRSDQYVHQVKALLKHSDPAVRTAAAEAAQQLKLADDANRTERSGGKLIQGLAFDETVAMAVKDAGNVKSGNRLFVQQGCVACHTVSPDEAPKGPFLGGIATRYSRAELCESILKPSAKIAQGFETQWFKTRDGEEIEGFVTREGGDDLDVRNVAGITTTLDKKDIAERGKRETSVMPVGLADTLTPQELADLLAYLESLKSK